MKYFVPMALIAASSLSAQEPARTMQIPEIIVTAERSKTELSSSTAAVTRLSAADIARMPHATLADVLRRSPGFSQVDADGMGFDPRVIVRGFYGGGEAEYVVVMVDGKPVNQLNTGLVAWDVLPVVSAIESIEIVRGSSSALYGDAALGGSINIITRKSSDRDRLGAAVSGGSFGLLRGSLDGHARVLGSPFSLSGGIDRSSGFRDHAERTSSRATMTFPLVEPSKETGRLDLILRGEWRNYQDPGALIADLASANPGQSDDLFRFDRTTDAFYHATVEIEQPTNHGPISGSFTYDNREIDATRTIALAPGFGDTKDRDLTTRGAHAAVQYDVAGGILPQSANLIVGGEYGRGKMTSKYFLLASGDRDAYRASDGARGDQDAAGDGSRSAGALFAELSDNPVGAVHLTAGVRVDWLSDKFRPRAPDDVTEIAAKHAAISPKLGLNIRYAGGNNGGHVYLAGSRSFKAPTLDQLFDQRSIPVPFPPYALRTSNSDLKPQYGTSIETGLYQDLALSPSIHSSLSLAVYTMDMKDELDFDVAALKYDNIGRSRHRGVEAGLTIAHARSRSSAFVNYTVQSATSRTGENIGNYLKAIPRNTVTAGITWPMSRSTEIGVVYTSLRNTWLDDANTVPLAPHSTFDAHFSMLSRYFTIFAWGRNLTGTKYQSSGYLDPSGSGQAYFYPGAGRSIEIGIRR